MFILHEAYVNFLDKSAINPAINQHNWCCEVGDFNALTSMPTIVFISYVLQVLQLSHCGTCLIVDFSPSVVSESQYHQVAVTLSSWIGPERINRFSSVKP